MDKLGFLPSGGTLPFEMHLEKLQEPARSAMLDLRNFVKSLGPSVIEEVRPHRVVYAKTLTFRTFLDIEPAIDHLVIEIRSSRSSPPVRTTARTPADCEEIKKQIAGAYEKIR